MKPQPSSAGSALLKQLNDDLQAKAEPAQPPGYYVVDRSRERHAEHLIMRGPYQHSAAAAAVRTEMERSATPERLERWNLAIEFRGPDLTEPTLAASLELPPSPWQIGGVVAVRDDGQRVVAINSAHPDGGGQNIAECLESCAALIIEAPNLIEAVEGMLGAMPPALQKKWPNIISLAKASLAKVAEVSK